MFGLVLEFGIAYYPAAAGVNADITAKGADRMN